MKKPILITAMFMAMSVWTKSETIYLLDEVEKFGGIWIKVYCISDYVFVSRGNNKAGSLTQIITDTGVGLTCTEYKKDS